MPVLVIAGERDTEDGDKREEVAVCERHTRQAKQASRAAPPVGRNDPCLCGSGRKYKRCCGA